MSPPWPRGLSPHGNVMAELNANSSDALTYRYIYGPGVDRPVARWSSGGLDYYYYDGQGSVIGMSGASATEKYSYDPYGKPDNDSGNVYRYTGRRLDAETGYYYYRAGYYDPDIGRFLSADPIGYGDGLNMYRYVSNDPINKIDPTGTDEDCPGCSMVTSIASHGGGWLVGGFGGRGQASAAISNSVAFRQARNARLANAQALASKAGRWATDSINQAYSQGNIDGLNQNFGSHAEAVSGALGLGTGLTH